MIEAAERQSRLRDERNPPAGESLVDAIEHADDGEEHIEMNHMITGITSLSGSCGTYVVKAASGLTMVPSDPRRSENEMDGNAENEVATNSVALEEGQKLQIVDFEDGVARLARNRGYVKATAGQLVKVGIPLDEACKLEGLLMTVQAGSAELQKEIEDYRQMENKLRRQFDIALESDETHPIITDPSSLEEGLYESSTSISFESVSITHPATPDQSINQPVLETPESSSSTRRMKDSESTSLTAPLSSLGSSDTRRRFSQHPSKGNGEFVLGCGATLLGNPGHLFYQSSSEDDENCDTNSSRARRSESEDTHQSFLRAPTQTSSFDGIDFRTGLSGHRALTSARSSGQYMPRSGMRLMMSQHRGVSNTRPYKGSPPMPPSLSFTDSPLK